MNRLAEMSIEDFCAAIRKNDFGLGDLVAVLKESDIHRKEVAVLLQNNISQIADLKFQLLVQKTAAEIVASAIRTPVQR